MDAALDASEADTVNQERIWCDVCCTYSEEPCWKHAVKIHDTSVVPLAVCSLPDVLRLEECSETLERRVVAAAILSTQWIFGPLVGPCIPHPSADCRYARQDLQLNEQLFFHLESDYLCNWMKYVTFTDDLEEQNLRVFLCEEEVYFVTVRRIFPGEVLKVGYSKQYASLLEEKVQDAHVDAAENKLHHILRKRKVYAPEAPKLRRSFKKSKVVSDEIPVLDEEATSSKRKVRKSTQSQRKHVILENSDVVVKLDAAETVSQVNQVINNGTTGIISHIADHVPNNVLLTDNITLEDSVLHTFLPATDEEMAQSSQKKPSHLKRTGLKNKSDTLPGKEAKEPTAKRKRRRQRKDESCDKEDNEESARNNGEATPADEQDTLLRNQMKKRPVLSVAETKWLVRTRIQKEDEYKTVESAETFWTSLTDGLKQKFTNLQWIRPSQVRNVYQNALEKYLKYVAHKDKLDHQLNDKKRRKYLVKAHESFFYHFDKATAEESGALCPDEVCEWSEDIDVPTVFRERKTKAPRIPQEQLKWLITERVQKDLDFRKAHEKMTFWQSVAARWNAQFEDTPKTAEQLRICYSNARHKYNAEKKKHTLGEPHHLIPLFEQVFCECGVDETHTPLSNPSREPYIPRAPWKTKFIHQCQECGIAFKRNDLLELHNYDHTKEPVNDEDLDLKCPACLFVGTKAESLFQHIVVHSKKIENVEQMPPRHNCEVCGDLVPIGYAHLRERHPDKYAEVEATWPVGCDMCGRRFLTPGAVRLHHAFVHKEKNFCLICKTKYRTRRELRAHVESHRIDGQLQCPVCPRTYRKYSSLHTHNRDYHDVTRLRVCEVCGKVGAGKRWMDKHRDVHKEYDMPCPECGKLFRCELDIRKHLKSVHTEYKLVKQAKRKLEWLQQKGVYKNQDRQLLYYTLPFKCEKCRLGYKYKGKYLNHLRERHPEDLEE